MPLRLRATDELDLFLYWHENRLFVVPNPRGASDKLPHLSEPRQSDFRRFEQQKFVIVSSRTDALDEWYYRAQPGGTPEAPKPRLN